MVLKIYEAFDGSFVIQTNKKITYSLFDLTLYDVDTMENIFYHLENAEVDLTDFLSENGL